MIYFLSVLHLFFLISVSSKQCRDPNPIQETGGIKESSENGNYYGIISTPNFPQPFKTPFVQTWVIDASHRGNDTRINLYLTQMYLSHGVRFYQRPVASCDKVYYRRGPRQECRKPVDQHHPEIYVDKLYDVVRVSTTCPYLEIEVDVPTLYGYHYRTRDNFLFNVYGFNITYEIVPESYGIQNDSCCTRNCSNLGHCYLASNYRDFFCDCVNKDNPRKYCEFSPYCDPANNITFCYNGGKCKIVGSGDGYCDCSQTGFTGAKCEKRIEPKVSARTVCSNPLDCPVEEVKPSCTQDQLNKPCSCRPTPKGGKPIPADWVKYVGIVAIDPSYSVLKNQTTIGYAIQSNISSYFKSKNVSINYDLVYVRFYWDSPTIPPQKLYIHFHGPDNLRDKISDVLQGWLNDKRTKAHFYRQVPLVREKFSLEKLPRLKFQSLEMSKGERLKIDKPVSLTCKATTGALSNLFSLRDIQFRWFKDGMPINKSLTTRGIVFRDLVEDGNETMSVLSYDLVSPFDGGVYTCEVTDLEFGDQECGRKEIEITLPPQIEVDPMSLTLERQKLDLGKVIICTDGNPTAYNPRNKSTGFVWYRGRGSSTTEEVQNNDVVVLEDIIPRGKLLRILRAERSEVFTCSGSNRNGETRNKVVEVNVLDSRYSPSCNNQSERLAKSKKTLLWEWTAPRSVAMLPCPEGFIGYVQRPCLLHPSGKVQWGRSDFSRCIAEQLQIINATLQNTKRGFGDWSTSSPAKLLGDVENYVTSNQILYAGEGEKIVGILEEIVKYAFDIGKVGDLSPVFFRTIEKFMKIPSSCVQERSVRTLCKVIRDMSGKGALTENKETPQFIRTDKLAIQILPISKYNSKYDNYSYVFPLQKEIKDPLLSWLKDKVRVIFPLDSDSLPYKDFNYLHYLIIGAYKNLSNLLAPNDQVQAGRGVNVTPNPNNSGRNLAKKSLQTSIELISPIVQISIPEGYFPRTHIKIHFNLSREHLPLIRKSKGGSAIRASEDGNVPALETNFSCGVLDHSPTKVDDGRLRWKPNACSVQLNTGWSHVECQCETAVGEFGLLKVSKVEDEIAEVHNEIPRIIITGFTLCILSCVLSAVILCIYLGCRISVNSLYSLKLLDCFFVFSAVFIVLLGRTEIPSASWLAWSALACSCLISSLSVQVTKALRILLMEVKSDLPRFIFPWLRNVSQLTLLSAITFSTVLPIWTATVAKLIGQNARRESAFEESSHVFAVFIGTVSLVVLVFLAMYYKAVLKTKSELDLCRQQNPTSTFQIWKDNYRMKTLNRSLCLTLLLLVMTLAIILYENIRNSLYIQYFLGFSAIAMGIALLLCYVTHAEFPVLGTLCSRVLHTEKPSPRDPEIESSSGAGHVQRKMTPHYSEITMGTGNGSIPAADLLPPPPPCIRRIPGRYYGEESEALSVSTVEEQSMDTFSTDISYRHPPHSQPQPIMQKIPLHNHHKRRSLRSTGSNTVSSSASSCRSQRNPSVCSAERVAVPPRMRCLLTMSTGDYIYPTNHTSSIKSDTSSLHPIHDQSSEASAAPTYIPINDHQDNNGAFN